MNIASFSRRSRLLAVALATAFLGCAQEKSLIPTFVRTVSNEPPVARAIDIEPVSHVTSAMQPVTVETRTMVPLRPGEQTELTLREAVTIALENSTFLRIDEDFLSRHNGLLQNPSSEPSAFHAGIQASNVLFEQRGIDAALADFDWQCQTSMLWGRDELVQNVGVERGLFPGDVFVEESGVFASRLSKTLRDGAQFGVQHDWIYSGQNVFPPASLYPSTYRGLLSFQYRRPLGAASGREFTEIAGPSNIQVPGITGVSQGIAVARINTEIAADDFELAIQHMLKDVEDLYWELALAYRLYNSDCESHVRLQEVRQRTKDTIQATGRQTTDSIEYFTALEKLLEYESRVNESLANVYEVEGRLRRVLGLSIQLPLFQPIDSPTTAAVALSSRDLLSDAYSRRVELQRQRSRIRILRMELSAARNMTQPRLDFVSEYRINGFGDRLFHSERQGTTPAFNPYPSAYDNLFRADQTGWIMGFEFGWPIGLRAAQAQVRNLQLRLSRAQAGLETQEQEIAHELSHALLMVNRHFEALRIGTRRRDAARRRVELLREAYDLQNAPLNARLEAEVEASRAEIAYYESLIHYNQALSNVHFRRGTILDLNDVRIYEEGDDRHIRVLSQLWMAAQSREGRSLEQPFGPLTEIPSPSDTSESDRRAESNSEHSAIRQ